VFSGDYPASSPYVLGCGGTAITLDAARKAIASEVVWNDKNRRGTGGGSATFLGES
jgi:kumamolisin